MRGPRASFLALSTVLAAASLTSAASAAEGGAALSLASSNGQMTQTSDTERALSKIGTIDDANSRISWTITATEGVTTAGHLVIGEQLTVTNTGSGGATLGNVVLNPQTKSGAKWVTRSSDVTDATNGDAATTAKIVASASSENKSSFTENAASGELGFMDSVTNTIFSLVPQVRIRPGQSKSLLLHASFDNNVLHLTTGTSTRAEIIVSFGNAIATPASASNVDINGNGVIDPDEARVRSVATRLGLTVPAQTGSGTPTLTDTLDDITTTGTVTFSNAQFDLGATSGTVTVDYDAGADGGTIANCAHLTGGSPPNDIDLEACDTQTIEAPPTCTPGAHGCGWEAGDMMTFNQTQWGDRASTGGVVLGSYMDAVYAATAGVLEAGMPGATGFSMLFTGSDAVIAYLPAIGPVGQLTGDLLNPTSSSSGALGGEVVALELNIDFSDADVIGGSAPLRFGDLQICNFALFPILDGRTVRQFASNANMILGGGSGPISANQAAAVSNLINGVRLSMESQASSLRTISWRAPAPKARRPAVARRTGSTCRSSPLARRNGQAPPSCWVRVRSPSGEGRPVGGG